MSRSRRHWPAAIIDKLWHNRHALDRMIERGCLEGKDAAAAEDLLRNSVAQGISDNKKITASAIGSKNLFLIAIPTPRMTYALVEKGDAGGKYDYLIRTVFSKEQYERHGTKTLTTSMWEHVDLKTIEETRERLKPPADEPKKAPDPLPEPAEAIVLCGGKTKLCSKEELSQMVLQLLECGVPLSDIATYYRRSIRVKVVLD